MGYQKLLKLYSQISRPVCCFCPSWIHAAPTHYFLALLGMGGGGGCSSVIRSCCLRTNVSSLTSCSEHAHMSYWEPCTTLVSGLKTGWSLSVPLMRILMGPLHFSGSLSPAAPTPMAHTPVEKTQDSMPRVLVCPCRLCISPLRPILLGQH